MDLIKLSEDEAVKFLQVLDKMQKRELLKLFADQVFKQIFIVGQMELARPIVTSTGEIIKSEDEFVELEGQYWQLKDEMMLTERFILESMNE